MKERLIELLKEHCVLRQDVSDCTNRKTDDCPECLADYLIANGVIVPPVKVGQSVWCIVEVFDYLMEGRVRRFTVGENWINIYCGVKGYYEQVYSDRDIGKTVFLTPEEAEAMLKERDRK